ncbi:synovial sarcoma, X member B family member [Mus musculus]|uniref:SSX member B14 n=1 Tax=Mus musculus TaxID=10090 RepID=A2AHC7_MOUSE|nr:synovial sarcoma, X member B family member [Mus musculus]|eukprot:NP_001075033.1 synovial sarcoma, X member B family member [Mus musculus]
METVISCEKIPMEVLHKPKNICKAFQDISTYFSGEEWGKLTEWQKSAYMYMKRNYTRMTGVTVNQPVFMSGKEQAKQSLVKGIEVHDSEDECFEESFGVTPRKRMKLTSVTISIHNVEGSLASGENDSNLAETDGIQVNVWSHRLRERKYRVIYSEISDPEEEEDDDY